MATLSRANTLSSRPLGSPDTASSSLSFTTAACTFSPSLASRRRNDAPSCIRGAIVLHPKRPAQTRAQNARTPEQRLALPCPTVPQPHILPFPLLLDTRCDAWLTRALQVPSIRLTRALFDRETHLPPPLLPPSSLGNSFSLRFRFRATSLSQAAVSASLHITSASHAPLIDQVTETRRPFRHL